MQGENKSLNQLHILIRRELILYNRIYKQNNERLYQAYTRQENAKAWLIHQVKMQHATFRSIQCITYIDNER